MTIQRNSDDECDDTDSVNDLPIVLPKHTVSQAKLDHLARARQRKAELAHVNAVEKAKHKEELVALQRGMRNVKDQQSKEIIKKEIMKATALRQPKQQAPPPAPAPEQAPPVLTQKARKQPKIVLEESEPEIVYVKVPKKKIVVQQSETESEVETIRPPRSRQRRKPVPVESETESEYDAPAPPPAPKAKPAVRPRAPQPAPFTINF